MPDDNDKLKKEGQKLVFEGIERDRKAAVDRAEEDKLVFEKRANAAKAGPKITQQDNSPEDSTPKEQKEKMNDKNKEKAEPENKKKDLSWVGVGKLLAGMGSNTIKGVTLDPINWVAKKISEISGKGDRKQSEKLAEAENNLKNAARGGPKGAEIDPIVPMKDAQDAKTPPLVPGRQIPNLEEEAPEAPNPKARKPK